MLYAFGLDAGNIQYNSVDDSAILVTVNRDLTIVVSASPTGPAIYADHRHYSQADHAHSTSSIGAHPGEENILAGGFQPWKGPPR